MNRILLVLICSFLVLIPLNHSSWAEDINDSKAWAVDIKYFTESLPKLHINLFFKLSESEFTRRMSELELRLPGMSDIDVYLELARIIASIGDTHTSISPKLPAINVAVKFGQFSDGIFPIMWDSRYPQFSEGRLVAVGDIPISEVINKLSELVPADNEAYVKHAIPNLLNSYTLMTALKLIPDEGFIRYWLEDNGGFRRAVDIKVETDLSKIKAVQAYDPTKGNMPIYLKKNSWFWYEGLADGEVLYIQYNNCNSRELMAQRNPSDPNLDKYPVFGEFAADVLKYLDSMPVKAVVVDLRNNGGGNSMLGTDFIKALSEHPKFGDSFKVYGIIGRKTFSSAIINSVDLKNFTGAVLYGEATAGKPNHYGEVKSFVLPNSKWIVTYSTKYFRFLEDDFDSLYPDIPVTTTYKEYVDGKDPVLEKLLSDLGY